MKKTLATFGAIAVMAGASVLPTVPYSASYAGASFEYDCVGHTQQVFDDQQQKLVDPAYNPEPCTGKKFVSEYTQYDGSVGYAEITQAKYQSMGAKNGILQNPVSATLMRSPASLLVGTAHAAIAANTGGAWTPSSGAVASLTYAYTCTSCTANSIITTLGRQDSSSGSITGVTYNAVAYTQAIGSPISGDANDVGSFWYLFGPTAGANNVVVTAAGSAHAIQSATASYTGTVSSGLDNHGAEGPSVASPATLSITTTADNSWMIGFIRSGSGDCTMTNGTIRTTGNNNQDIADNGPKTPAGSITLACTNAASFYQYIIAITVAPGAAAATSQIFPFDSDF